MCAGGGFVLALMCDLRFAAEDAVFTTVFSKRGLVAEHATSWLLPRLVGTGRALDLLWSSRRVSGSEAVEMGLAERLAESGHVVQTATAYVKDLAASTSPQSLKITKELVHAHWSTSFETAAQDGHGATMRSLGAPDFAEGVASFLERRAPNFGRIGETS
jgi:enoyl-CoA hydratase/carnithine racemase